MQEQETILLALGGGFLAAQALGTAETTNAAMTAKKRKERGIAEGIITV